MLLIIIVYGVILITIAMGIALVVQYIKEENNN